MEKYSEYVEAINDHIGFMIGIIVFIGCVICALILLCIRVKDKKLLRITCISGIVIMLFMYFICIFPCQKDLKYNAFKTYEGEFYVDRCYSVNRGGCYILIRSSGETETTRYRVLCDVTEVEDDTNYNGFFVISENSQCLVDIDF